VKKLPCIVDAQPVIHCVLKVRYDDGYGGVDDLRPLIAKGKVFACLSAPGHFAAVRVDEFGHSVSWLDDQGCAIDLSADSLRRDAERQAEIHRLMGLSGWDPGTIGWRGKTRNSNRKARNSLSSANS
jgi:Protein of unknown function (DUF2442)